MLCMACSVAQFTTDDIGLLWLTKSTQTTAALAYLRTLATNSSYGILGESRHASYVPQKKKYKSHHLLAL